MPDESGNYRNCEQMLTPFVVSPTPFVVSLSNLAIGESSTSRERGQKGK